jgi:hypothetical protein
LHRYGVFDRQSGRAVAYGYSWTATELAPPPSRPLQSGDPTPGAQYHVPLDDQEEHWRRLYAEHHIWSHPDHRERGIAHVGKLRHQGGAPHPDQQGHAHVQLGGALAWDDAPHPLVQAEMERLAALSFEDLFAHFCGPQWRTNGRITEIAEITEGDGNQ